MLQSVLRCVGLLVVAALCCSASSGVTAKGQDKEKKEIKKAEDNPKSFAQYTVEGYQITHFGSGKGRPDLRTWLILYSKENKTGVAGAIGFYTPEGLKQASDSLDGDDRPQGAMPIADLPAVLNTLQTSKQPVRLYWIGGPWQTTFLESGGKPLTRAQVETILQMKTGAGPAEADRETSYKVRVYNETDVELRIRNLHPVSGLEADPELLDVKGKGKVQRLRAGDRVLIAVDPIKDKVLLAEKFELSEGKRITLVGKAPDIKISLQAVGMGDP